MTRLILQRLFFSAARLGVIFLLLMLLIEFAFCGLGGSDQHIWQAGSYTPFGSEVEGMDGFRLLFSERSAASLRVLVIAISCVLLTGYGWGFLAARLRRYRIGIILRLPFSVFSAIPGFWFVILIAIYSYSIWQRPGFADEVIVTSGPDLLGWWHAFIVALPLIAAGSASLMTSVFNAISSEMSRPYTHGLFVGGYNSESIFYDHVVKGAGISLIRALDRPLPLLFGLLVGIEFAFRYRGMGSLLVESVNAANYGGIILGSMWLIGLISIINWLRDCAVHLQTGEVTNG
ncbi:MAG: ABC transporter permease subunit [Verrucomicrobiales bacterium]|nr:ABC transporter permease subunit [Verrucomicrobiales bacterium]